MLTKDSAAAAANELIGQQTVLRREAADARLRVNFLYDSRQLRALPIAERVKTIQQAQQTVRRRKAVIAVTIAWAAIFLLGWYLALPLPAVTVVFMWVVAVLPVFALQTFLVRREIRRLISAPHSPV
jgi:Flp pilus assembly protein TadB